MSVDAMLVTIVGVASIIGTYWFFFMKPKKIVHATGDVTIAVSGGYNPSVITIPRNKKTTLHFLRTDDNSCLEEVVLSDFKIKKFLPLNQTVSVAITPKKPGEYTFSCGMNMNHGKIIVE